MAGRKRYPSIRYIVSHAGGTVPYIAWRIAATAQIMPGAERVVPKGPLHYLQKLYYDTALSTSDQVMAALAAFVPQSQVLFGSDWPMGTTPALKMEDDYLSSTPVLTDKARRAIDRDNALALFPRLALATDRPALRATA